MSGFFYSALMPMSHNKKFFRYNLSNDALCIKEFKKILNLKILIYQDFLIQPELIQRNKIYQIGI